MKKFEMIDEVKEINGLKVFRIRALKSFGDVKAGERGGWIEQESNLAKRSCLVRRSYSTR